MVMQLVRWAPTIPFILVGDGAFACAKLSWTCFKYNVTSHKVAVKSPDSVLFPSEGPSKVTNLPPLYEKLRHSDTNQTNNAKRRHSIVEDAQFVEDAQSPPYKRVKTYHTVDPGQAQNEDPANQQMQASPQESSHSHWNQTDDAERLHSIVKDAESQHNNHNGIRKPFRHNRKPKHFRHGSMPNPAKQPFDNNGTQKPANHPFDNNGTQKPAHKPKGKQQMLAEIIRNKAEMDRERTQFEKNAAVRHWKHQKDREGIKFQPTPFIQNQEAVKSPDSVLFPSEGPSKVTNLPPLYEKLHCIYQRKSRRHLSGRRGVRIGFSD